MREIRKRIGLTQFDLAEKLGVRPNTIVRYEGGLTVPNETLVKYGALALSNGYYDLAESFRDAAIDGLGADVETLMKWEPGRKVRPIQMPIPDELREIVMELVDTLQNPRDELDEGIADVVLARMRNRRQKRIGSGKNNRVSGQKV